VIWRPPLRGAELSRAEPVVSASAATIRSHSDQAANGNRKRPFSDVETDEELMRNIKMLDCPS
jgi:hypothetical protein